MSSKTGIEVIKKIKAEVAHNKQTLSTIGIIVDATNPYRKDIKRDYCMRLKIIDSSYSNDFLTVFLFAKNIEQFPSHLAVGDILYLRNFVFETDAENFSCKKPFGAL